MKNPLFLLTLVSALTAPAWAQGPAPLASSGGLPPGLYVQVLDGLINVTNPAGTTNFTAGQFGFTPSFKQPPVILPMNPGMKFTPPPAFAAPVPGSASNSPAASNDVMCIVR